MGSELPREIWVLVALKLPNYALIRLSCCCKVFLRLIRPLLGPVNLPLEQTGPLPPFCGLFFDVGGMAGLDYWTHVTSLRCGRDLFLSTAFENFVHLRALSVAVDSNFTVPVSWTRLESLSLADTYQPLPPHDWSKFSRLTNFEGLMPGDTPAPNLRSLYLYQRAGPFKWRHLNPLTSLSALEKLFLGWLTISPKQFFHLLTHFPRLRDLSIANDIKDLPTGATRSLPLRQLPQLTKLHSREAGPCAMWLLSQLTSVRAFSFGSSFFEYNFSFFSNLRELDIIHSCPVPLSLTKLVLNGLSYENTVLMGLTNLEFLKADRIIPFEDYATLTNLRTLEIFGYGDHEKWLSDTSPFLSRLSNLRALSCPANVRSSGISAFLPLSDVHSALIEHPSLEVVCFNFVPFVKGDLRELLFRAEQKVEALRQKKQRRRT